LFYPKRNFLYTDKEELNYQIVTEYHLLSLLPTIVVINKTIRNQDTTISIDTTEKVLQVNSVTWPMLYPACFH